MKSNYQKEYFNNITEKDRDIYNFYHDFLTAQNISLKNKKICDIGCARGLFFKKLISKNDCYGFDISKYAIDECKKNYPNIAGNFKVLDLNKNRLMSSIQYDIVTLFDIVEHLDNFSNLKDIINENVKDNGILVITTPNANSFFKLLFGKKKYTGELDKTHTFLFTPYTLDFFLRRSGLKKVTLSTPYAFYFKDNFLTKVIPFGGQIFAIYKKC